MGVRRECDETMKEECECQKREEKSSELYHISHAIAKLVQSIVYRHRTNQSTAELALPMLYPIACEPTIYPMSDCAVGKLVRLLIEMQAPGAAG